MCRDAPEHATGPTPGQRGHSQSSASSRYTSGVNLHFTRVVDETGARAWHAIDEVAVPFDHPGLVADPLQEVVARLPDDLPSQKVALYLALAEEEVVAVGLTELPMVDNLHFASIGVVVPPRLRRRGYGRQMFEYLREKCRAADRSVLASQVGAPLGGTSAGESFARALGARCVLEELRGELKLTTIDRNVLDGLEGQARAHSTGYEVVQWIDHAPDDVVEDAARLAGRLVTDAPMGELSLEAEHWDAARMRESERETIDRGRIRAATGARHIGSGRLVASTEIAVPRSQPQIGYQWGTLVDPEHRGHRLGLLIKIANLRLLEHELAGVEAVETWTATVNTHMVAINKAIGFRSVERFGAWEVKT